MTDETLAERLFGAPVQDVRRHILAMEIAMGVADLRWVLTGLREEEGER